MSRRPALVLFFLSPAIAELLSGSSPPATFFNPFSLAMLAALYGSGAILVRDTALRWGKGWPTVLTLGAAYGIVEEGLMTKSFFDPAWPDLGILGSYGRLFDVNWVWALGLTMYHAVFSIGIPILLVGLLFPSHRSEPLVGRRMFRRLWVLLWADVAFGFFFLSAYRPPFLPYALAVLTVVVLYRVARRLPASLKLQATERIPRARWFYGAGFAATLGFFILLWAVPGTGFFPLIPMVLMIGLAAFAAKQILEHSGNAQSWTEAHQLALTAGAVTFLILLGPIEELSHKKNSSGMTLVTMTAVGFLLWLARRVSSASRKAAGAVTTAP